ncbi:MAG: glycerate kinase [Streptosporangiales bacterium]|nr:glycerate kinase [Streptosporangiales bacterium]
MHLIAAPDKFRGTASAPEVAAAIADAAAVAGWSCRQLPLADGGEGTVDAFDGPNRWTEVTGPLGGPVEAAWRLDGAVAVVEMASASGLALAGGKSRNDPVTASTVGTGQLIAAAIDAGAQRVIVGIGGSATTDGGLGAVDVLEPYAPLDASRGAQVLVACDVTTPFVDAAAIFGPQKGADEHQIGQLRQRLVDLAGTYADRFGVHVADLPGSGGAGGLGGGLAALGATLAPGFDLIADERGLPAAVAGADLVITGEGLLDPQSLAGKVVGGVAKIAGDERTAAVVGAVADGMTVPFPVISLLATYGEQRAFRNTLSCVREATAGLLERHRG